MRIRYYDGVRGGGSPLVAARLVVAGGAAGFAVHQAVGADAGIDYRLAEAAELFAFTLIFRLFALCAAVFGVAGSG